MSLEQLTPKLTAAFSQGDYEACSKLLPSIKIELINNNLLIPSLGTKTNPNDLAITRSILELGALASFNLVNLKEFSNYITQLKPFYDISTILPESENKSKLLSLYLLLLLTQGDLALFHIELERFNNSGLSVDQLEQDEFLSIPIRFEKWITDGDFNKVYELLSSEHNFPCHEFNLFENDLLESIRLTIATNFESAYSSLPLENLKLLLFFKDLSDVNVYIESKGWTVENNVVYFNKQSGDDGEINDEKVIVNNALGYAKEMESII